MRYVSTSPRSRRDGGFGERITMRSRAWIATLAALVLLTAAAPASAQQQKVLKIGAEQDPQTLNPFIDEDEEDFRVWSINYDLLVNFSPKDLSPSPGIARTWTVSGDKKTVTFKLFPRAKWSDGQPITSKDVKWSLDNLGGNGVLFTSYVENIGSIDTPDDLTVVVHLKKPDARLVGGLFVYILPEHIWGKVPLKQLTGSYRPKPPMVGSGPFYVSQFRRGRIIRMVPNPDFRGPKPKFDEIEGNKCATGAAVGGRLKLGEIDGGAGVEASTFPRLDKTANVKGVKAPSPSFTELAFNLCPKSIC